MTRLYKGIEIPENDDQRVEAIGAYGILETPPEQEYDDVTKMAAQITGCPVAYISIFDKTRSWLKSSYGLPPNRPPRPREQSMCAPTICQQEMLVIDDLRKNPRYANLPAVVNPPHARFYCGVPLINRDAYALGTLCVWSSEAVQLSDTQLDAMNRLARLTLDALEKRRDLLEKEAECAEIEAQLTRSRDATERAEALVHRLLPQAAATRLLARSEVAARSYDDVAVICIRWTALETGAIVPALTGLVSRLDATCNDLGLERIGLVGDAYFAFAGGRDQSTPSIAEVDAAANQLVQSASAALEKFGSDGPDPEIRSGVAKGSLLAVLVGEDRLNFTYWGQPMQLAYEAAQR